MKKVLWIDDDEEIMLNSEFLFKNHGFEIIKCTSPIKGLELIKEKGYKNILLDINFPNDEKEGLNLLEVLSTDEFEHLNVVVFTAYTDLDEAQYAREIKAEYYLQKPIPLGKEQIAEFFNHLHSSFNRKAKKRSKTESIAKPIFVMTSLLSLIMISGGIALMFTNKEGTHEIEFLGQSINSTSSGLALSFLGALLAYYIFKKLI